MIPWRESLWLFCWLNTLCVGKIVQSHRKEKPFSRGQEKGYFLFGGSTVVMVSQKGALTIDKDLLDYSQKGIETYIRLGDKIAKCVQPTK